jgi:hypothetical protein
MHLKTDFIANSFRGISERPVVNGRCAATLRGVRITLPLCKNAQSYVSTEHRSNQCSAQGQAKGD